MAFAGVLRRRARAPRMAVLKPYAQPGLVQRHPLVLVILVGGLASLYGYVFATYGTAMLMPMAAPLALMAFAAIWALPRGEAPAILLERLFFAFFFALLIWPDYLAIAIPGLPWITMLRLIGGPMLFILLICLSVSPDFRSRLAIPLKATRSISTAVLILALLCVMSIALSRDPGQTLNKVIIALTNWFVVFLVGTMVFMRPGRVDWFARALWAVVVVICLVGLWEAHISRVPWAGHIPSFLKIDDPSVQRALAGQARSTTGVYRVHSKFGTSLGLGEYLGLALPFILHILFMTSRLWVRILAIATVVLACFIAIRTDSRLAITAFMMSILLYLLGWAVMRWRLNRSSLFGPAILLAYPIIFAAFIVATFAVGRLRAMVWGNGATSASSEARRTMYDMGLPMLARNPLGYGLGQGGSTLGYTNGAGVLTIDTYYLAVALELGVFGFILYYFIFLAAIYQSASTVYQARDSETLYLVPLGIAFVNFVMSKSVYSQIENHPLIFMMLGAAVALIARHRLATVAAPAQKPATALPAARLASY